MPNEPEKNYLEWIQKAEDDDLSAKVIIKEGGAPSTACFLSQQMAEKYLKSLLVFQEKSFPKAHDLLEIATLLLSKSPDIEDLKEDLVLLNRYYIETRYPGDYPQFSLEEGQKAYEAAMRVRDFVLDKIHRGLSE
ncbi:MAG: HEPN domain-containing protein [Patescibacteria group bacterium]